MINNNITEDFCSLEVSKLLKEKGFILDREGFHTPSYKECKPENSEEEYTVCPTHSIAIKWIIENFQTWVGISILSEWGTKEGDFWIFHFRKKSNKWIITFPNNHNRYNSPKEATEAALKYFLTELIKEL